MGFELLRVSGQHPYPQFWSNNGLSALICAINVHSCIRITFEKIIGPFTTLLGVEDLVLLVYLPERLSLCLPMYLVLTSSGTCNRQHTISIEICPVLKIPLNNNAVLFTLKAFPSLLNHFVEMTLSFFG